MRIKDGALEGLSEHVSMVLLGVLVFHDDFPFSHPFENFQVAALDVPRAREALATLDAPQRVVRLELGERRVREHLGVVLAPLDRKL